LAFPATGFGRLTAVAGAFQSELLCASSDPLIEKTASAISALEQLAAEFRDLLTRVIGDLILFASKLGHSQVWISWPRRCFCLAPSRIDAPTPRAVKDDEKENPAIDQGEFASIHDWEKLCLQRGHRPHVKHEVSDCHLAAREKGRDTREQPKRNQKSADEFDNARDKCEP